MRKAIKGFYVIRYNAVCELLRTDDQELLELVWNYLMKQVENNTNVYALIEIWRYDEINPTGIITNSYRYE